MTVAGAGALYAHQGGWDEILFVLAPLILFAVLLLLARRRVDQLGRDDEDDGTDGALDSDQRRPPP